MPSGLLEETYILICVQINHIKELSSGRHCYASIVHRYICKQQHTMAGFLMTDVTYFPLVIRHWSVQTLRWCTVSVLSRVWIAPPIQVSFTRTEVWRIYCGLGRHPSLNLYRPEFKSPRKLFSRSLTWEREFKQLCTTNCNNDWYRRQRGLRRGSWLLGVLRTWVSVFCVCRVLSGGGLCDGLITRSEESYWVYVCVCVFVCVRVKCALVQALRLCTGRTAHRGSRGIALLFHDQRY